MSDIDSDALDAGLDAVFREEGVRPGESVLDAIERRHGTTSRIELASDPSPGPSTESTDDSALILEGDRRYRIRGEIARGGVGVVLSGSDVDLGRDVAVKVLRKELADHPHIVERFVEEAQIEGQLQHPGVVPVYELGVKQDGRPFFAMKLVKGKTLAAFLDEREELTDDRRKLLAIFEQISLTVAYAHARGVVHRDLKPTNVMVGAFGEVQVVDWGLAKVKGREDPAPEEGDEAGVTEIRTVRSGSTGSASRVGSVLGTPSYMPPEQALGQVQLVDERADVFALGGILLAILTGGSPYPPGGRDTLLLAARAELDDAFARLDACVADEAMVTLCRDCLSKDMGSRPRNAAAVAKRVSEHLAAVEERTHNAEVSAARAKVKAEEERKRRRLTVALAVTVLLAVLTGGGGYLWMGKERRARAERTTRVVGESLQDTRELLGKARAAATGNTAPWDAALAAARNASEAAKAGEAPVEAAKDAEALFTTVQQEAAAAQAAAEQKEKDDAMVVRLREIRERRGEILDLRRTDDEYLAVFRAYGIDVDGLSTEAASAKITASAISTALIGALDEWAWVRRRVQKREEADHLIGIARAIDEDAFRRELRDAVLLEDREALLGLAARIDVREAGPASAWLLGLHLGRMEEHAPAVSLLQQAQLAFPSDFWVAFQLAYELSLLEPPQWAEACTYYRAALVARPESLPVRYQLGFALDMQDRWEETLAVWWDALRIDPDYFVAWRSLVATHERMGDLAGLTDRLRDRAEMSTNDCRPWVALGLCLMVAEEFDQAIAAFEEGAKADPDSPEPDSHRGLALFYKMDMDAAKAAYARALEKDPDHGETYNRLSMVHWAERNWAEAVEANRKAVECSPGDAMMHAGLGQCLREMGEFEEAIVEHEKSIELDPHHPILRIAFGRTLWLYEELDRAREQYETAHRIGPRLPDRRFSASFELSTDAETGKETWVPKLGWMADSTRAWQHLAYLNIFQWKLPEAEQCLANHSKLCSGCWLGGLWTGWVNYWQTDYEGALEGFESGLRANPRFGTFHYALGFTNLFLGRESMAREHFAKYYDAGRWPEGWRPSREEWDRDIDSFFSLYRNLKAHREPRGSGLEPREAVLLGWLLDERTEFLAGAEIFLALFERDPGAMSEPITSHSPMYAAAEAGLLAIGAGTGRGIGAETLDAAARRRWRDQGRRWLRAELGIWRERLDRGDSHAAAQASRLFGWWLAGGQSLSERLAPVRARSELRKLASVERAEWEKFWAEVRALANRAESMLAR